MPLGLYISVPFCRTKCSYCNFASDVFSRAVFEKYITRLCAEIEHSHETAQQTGGLLEPQVDSIYFGGGTPTLLSVSQLEHVFVTIRQNFEVLPLAEMTVECAPGTLSEPMLDCLVQCGVNRISLGVQSFVDQEARSVGRLHNRATVLKDIDRLRSAGISNINIDLIAGLPHQTRQSWEQSLDELIASGVPHASIYMLEVDEDSRLGRELMAGGQKYHAHFVPDEDLVADLYEIACDRLNGAGIQQYEISNFARAGFESKHNLKYWTRQPYLGFGVDAHSMLRTDVSPGAAHAGGAGGHDPGGHDFQSCRTQPNPADGTAESRALPRIHEKLVSRPQLISCAGEIEAIRFSNPDNLQTYIDGGPRQLTPVDREGTLQESCFLGLRLTRGINLQEIAAEFGKDALDTSIVDECIERGLMEQESDFLRLTPKGRLLSNEVFEKFISLQSAES